jgi:hypothetical protein
MLERIGELADKSRGMTVKQSSWFDSDLCILESVNSVQLAIFEQLKVGGLLCSRHSASVQGGRRFFALAKEGEKFPNGLEEAGEDRQGGQLQQPPTSLAVLDPDGGSQVVAGTAAGSEAVPEPAAAAVRQKEVIPPAPVCKPAGVPAGQPAGRRKLSVPATPTERWVMKQIEASSLTLVDAPVGGPAVESGARLAAIPAKKKKERPMPELKDVPAEGWAAAESAGPHSESAPEPASPAAAVQKKKRRSVDQQGGYRKKTKKSPPSGQSDLLTL